MRIISGKFKNKKLHFPKNIKTRPLKDSVRENIFNILCHSNNFNINIQNSNILDLYSGAGSFGLECISRRSKHVTFFENYPAVLKILKKNIQNLNCSKSAKIIDKDIFCLEQSYKDLRNYDFVFLDPPYKERKIKLLLEIIKKSKVLKRDSIILIHRDKKFIDEFPENFKVIKTKNYGRSKILFGKFC